MKGAKAEECANPRTRVPNAISLCVPVGGIAGIFFIIPICVTCEFLIDLKLPSLSATLLTVSVPPLADVIDAPAGQALPYIFHRVMGSPGGGLGLIFLVLVITIFCSISITVAASRCTWAFARDDAMPGSKIWAKVDKRLGVPLNALILVTVIQMLLGIINIGSSAAFVAFISVGVQALALSYGIP